jgi:hypothetical protein
MNIKRFKTISNSGTTKTLFFAIVLLSSLFAKAQDSTEAIMFRAMKDELDRNMDKLTYKDIQRPFYISYTIDDIKTIFVSASLGALTNSSEKHYRNWSNRVLAGDYQLNDENFVDATRSKPSRDGDIELPLDNDYYGIRRALWMMTNNTFKSAAENYKNKLEALKDKNLGKKDLQIPDFCAVPVVKLSVPDIKVKWDKHDLERLVKESSSVFKDYPDIYYSEVAAFQIHADIYFYSSESCQVKTPIDFITYTANAIYQGKEGDNIADQIWICAVTPDEIPDIPTISKYIQSLASNIIVKGNAPLLEENYTGPVLLLGQSVADVFAQGLFGGTDNLCAYREPLYNSSQMTMYYGQNINSLENKLDKQVTAKNLTVKDVSTLKVFNNTELVGSYFCDAEGVLPTDSMTLIENGILKGLYNGRTPTRNIRTSNGHNRYVFQGGSVTSDLGPGVLVISANDGKPVNKLKDELLKQAKEEGLDYAIMVKPIIQGNFLMPLNFYKVYVTDGREELLRTATMNQVSISSLKKVTGVASSTFLYNTLINTGGGRNAEKEDAFSGQGAIPSGSPVSFIIPDGLILKEAEFERQIKPLSTDKPIVKSPLIK